MFTVNSNNNNNNNNKISNNIALSGWRPRASETPRRCRARRPPEGFSEIIVGEIVNCENYILG